MKRISYVQGDMHAARRSGDGHTTELDRFHPCVRILAYSQYLGTFASFSLPVTSKKSDGLSRFRFRRLLFKGKR